MSEHRAKKSLGQHFLRDANIVAKIVRAAGVGEGDTVIEVGPGPGILTRALLSAGVANLIVIEKDTRFATDLTALNEPRLHVVEGDALEADEAALLAQHGAQSASIVSNLPYNVGTPLLVKWLKAPAWRGPMTLMFQKEVAHRIAAFPGSPAYGRLGVLAQAVCDCQIVVDVPAGAFTPPPKVDSAVVRLTDRADPYPHLGALERITATAFGQRRKMLRAALRSLGDSEALCARAGIDATRRAETLTQLEFRALADALTSARILPDG